MDVSLDEAVALIRELEPKLKAIGYHSGLTGGVLYRGTSKKDVDVVLYPRDPGKLLTDQELKAFLSGAGFEFHWETDREYVNRKVWIYFTPAGVRIDFFIFSQ